MIRFDIETSDYSINFRSIANLYTPRIEADMSDTSFRGIETFQNVDGSLDAAYVIGTEYIVYFVYD